MLPARLQGRAPAVSVHHPADRREERSLPSAARTPSAIARSRRRWPRSRGKWKLIIIYWLAEMPRHFGELRPLLPDVSQKVLTEQLREVADDDIISRERTGPVPAPVVYSLAEYGRSLVPLMETVRTWGRGHINHFASLEDSHPGAAVRGD
jgi:DNA-binding HxlR family transcriptional regulator